MKSFLIGLLVGLCLIPVGLFFYFRSGLAPVATSATPMPFEKFLAQMALHATLRRDAPKNGPGSATTADLVTAAGVFQKNCAFCHGLPKQPPSEAARGMFPRPPQLFNADELVTDDPVGVTYWKVKNGLRLSGMPGFGGSLSDQQLWQVSLLLSQADKLPPEVQAALQPLVARPLNPTGR